MIRGNEWQNTLDIEIATRFQEIYNRLVLEIAENLNYKENKELKSEIIELIKKTHNKKSKMEEYKTRTAYKIKKKLYKLIENFILEFTTTKGEKTHIYDENYQIRESCSNTKNELKNIGCKNTFCIQTVDNCKLYIPNEKKKLFVGMIVSELLTYGKGVWGTNSTEFKILVSGRIIDNSVSPIVNIDVFENHGNVVYERKTDLGNLLQNIKLNKELS